MGRKKKVIDGQVVSARLPKSFLNQIPSTYSNFGDWLRDLLLNNAEVPVITGQSGLNPEEKESVNYFYEFFMKLFTEGKLDEFIAQMPDLMDKAALFEKVAKNHV